MHNLSNSSRTSPEGVITGPFSPTIAISAFSMRFARDAEIYGEQEPAEYVYRVVHGAVRTYTITEDGRRQIDGFHLAGDIFGLETSPEHRFSAEAICDCEIAVVSRNAIERAAERDGKSARALWSLTAAQLGKVRDHMLILGMKGAAERVVAFLLEMAARERPGSALHLPMSRTDIADYLGLTIETVSRCFSKLERQHAIALQGARHVTLSNLHALEAIAA